MVADDLEIHPLLEQVAFLIGRWEGTSVGKWAPAGGLEFRDVVEFSHAGKPFLSYQQRTWTADGAPSHGEQGFLIATGPGTVDWTLAQPSGIVEVLTGSVGPNFVALRTGAVHLTPAAKQVTDVFRVYEVDGDTLSYVLQIGMNGEPLADHIYGTLQRAG